MRLSPDRAEEIAQDALATVLVGLGCDAGRHPKAHEVADKTAFRKYLYSVICSLTEAASRKGAVRAPHEPVGGTDAAGPHGSGVVVLRAPEAEKEQVALRDLKRELFRRLRDQCPDRLLATVKAWEEVFEYADRIPAGNRPRKYVSEVRELAQQVATELGLSPRPSPGHRSRRPAPAVALEDPAAHDEAAPRASCAGVAKDWGIPQG